MADFYLDVPRNSVRENLEWRLKMRTKAQKDAGLRRAIMTACKHDILYFLNGWCIAEDTPVLTLRGAVPIQDVTSDDYVWDGEQWVSQLGPVFQGTKQVIDAYGISLTPEHKVWTTYGWQRADCGHDRQEVRAPGGASIRRAIRQHQTSRMALPLRLRERSSSLRIQPSQATHKKLRMPKDRTARKARKNRLAHTLPVDSNARKVQKSQQSVLSPIWRSGDSRLRAMEGLYAFPGGHGNATAGNVPGPDRQQRQLRAGKLPVGNAQRAGKQYSPQPLYRDVDRQIDTRGGVQGRRDYHCSDALSNEAGANRGQSDCAAPTGSARVYDLVNCGPRRAFTVIDRDGNLLLVHNCFIIEPRTRFDAKGHEKAKVFPFLTWEHQDYWFPKVREALGRRNVVVEKCRGEGWTWFECLAALQDFLFSENTLVGLVSSTEAKSDSNSIGSIMGKCLAVDTPVLTPTGWTPLSSVRVGDELIGSSGQPTKVLRLVEPYEADIYRVDFSDGTTIRCTGNHKFPVCGRTLRRNDRPRDSLPPYEALDVTEIAKNLKNGGGRLWNYHLFELGRVEHEEQIVPVEPYVMGVLLGDGCLTKCSLEFSSVDLEIVGLVSRRLSGVASVNNWKGIVWGICDGPLKDNLRASGLLGKRAWEKWIPPEYKAGSVEQRVELLRGLMDTDGTVNAKTGSALFSTTSKRLAQDIRDIVLSLGGSSAIHEKKTTYDYQDEKHNGRLSYCVTIGFADINPFYLKRKADLFRYRTHTCAKQVTGIERDGTGLVSCVTVDAPDHLFVADGYALTHNCDWELTKLPTWMTGIRGRDRNNTGDWYRNSSDHALMNVKYGNQITAFAAGPDVGRGDRFTWFGLDEHASDEWKMEGNDERVLEALGGTTDSILSISTPKGAYGAFHRLVHAPTSDLKVQIDWRDNPSKNHGLYKLVNDRPVAVDPINNPLQANYDPPTSEISSLLSRLRKRGYDLDSKTRSPWLDRECDRGTSNPQNVAQEIERDYGGSVARIFGNHCVDVAEASVRPPDIYGRLSVYDDLTYSFDRMDNGEYQLWCQLDIHDKPPKHNYIVCADLASGDGGDYCNNSAIIVIDLVTGEQVLEFVTKTVKPPDMADKAIAIAKWFHNAYLAWEHMGPGASFTKQVIERGYGNCYERETQDKFTRKRTKKLGFDNRGSARENLFNDLERQIRTGDLLIRSKFLAEELTQYIRLDGKIKHVSVKGDDSSHGDRVIAVGVGVQAMKSRPLPKIEGKTVGSYDDPEPGTLAYREWMFNRMNEESADDWDDRSTADFRSSSRDMYTFN